VREAPSAFIHNNDGFTNPKPPGVATGPQVLPKSDVFPKTRKGIMGLANFIHRVERIMTEEKYRGINGAAPEIERA
jgi:hypothetical protein